MVSSPNGLRIGVSDRRRCVQKRLEADAGTIVDDGLSYCTWNGIGRELTEQKIFDALESLAKNNINISNLIIDDNWQSLVSILGHQRTIAHEE